MGKPLVVTKYLIPGRRADLLRRPRLIEFLHEHVDRKLVLVSAPAGYGKSSLLVEFAHDVDLPFCWYSVDKSDRDLRVFVEYLLAAIRHRFPGFGSQALELLEASDSLRDSEALVGVLVNEIYQEIPDYFVVVLDDYHLINTSEPINYFIDSLLQRLPENCHFVIASRTIPTLTPRGLAVLTARQEVVGLGARELRFTPQEIVELVQQKYNQTLPDDVAQELARQSEGWITGILLTTQAMWRDLFDGVVRVRSAGTGVYEYLASEVFAQQSPEVQRFLLGSAVLDEMSAERCDALLGAANSGGLLRFLEEGNVFTVRFEKEDERWYRYHALFQSYLREKLAAEWPEWKKELHLRAAGILAREGEDDGAFRHYLAAGDVQSAVRVVLEAAEELFATGHLETLAGWIDQFPEYVLEQVPRLLWYRGRVCQELGESARALDCFEKARSGFEAVGDEEAVAQVLVDQGVALRMLGRAREVPERCQEALRRLPAGGRQVIAAGAYRNLGISYCQLGSVQEGIAQLRQALRLYGEAESPYGQALTHADLGVALGLAGNMAASELHLEEALQLWERMGHAGNIANVLNNLANAQQVRGEHERALATFERALSSAQRAGSRRLQAIIWAGKGDVYRETACWEDALRAYNEAWQLAESLRDLSLLGYLLNATAEVHRARGEYAQALALARRAYEQATERGLTRDAARYEVTLAKLYLEQGHPPLALEYLQRAEQTFSRGGMRRELPMVWLQLARVAWARREDGVALDNVRRMAEAATELGHSYALIQEAARALEVLELAARAGVGGEFVADLVRRARRSLLEERSQPTSQAGEPTPLRLRIVGLGDSSVWVNDRLLSTADWGAAKAKEFFFYLVSFPARRKEQIGAVLWPDLSSGRLRSAFHVTLYRVRRALGINDSVLYENDQYFFNRQLEYQFDVEEFESLVAQAEQVASLRPLEAEEKYQRACELWKGEFLEGMSFANEEWLFWRRDELNRRHLGALKALGDLRMQRGAYEGALEAYRKLLARDALREDVHRDVMRCLALAGDRNAALRHYDALVALLHDELMVAPLPETAELCRLIASGCEELPTP